MTSKLENDLAAVARLVGENSQRIAQLGPSPEDRMAAAIAGRNPAGFTEVFAADVVALAAQLSQATLTPAIKDIASAAARNLAKLPDHRRGDFVVGQPTAALAALLEAYRGAAL